MTYQYTPSGVCSRKITFDIEDGTIHNVVFEGGCNGNAKGLSALAEGMDAKEAVGRLKGITCGFKDTSCPDQLSKALEKALEK